MCALLTAGNSRTRRACGMKPGHLRPARRKEGARQKRERILLDIGFASYRDYLKSTLWKIIREAKLDASPRCELCNQSLAAQIHHLRYSREALVGQDAWALVSACPDCHRRVEFNLEGRKRPYHMARKKATSMLRHSGCWREHERVSDYLDSL